MGTDPHAGAGGQPTLLYASVGLVSAAALAYELLLMRLLSVIHWHHFAYMIISLALLGYGASGSFLTLARDWLAAFPGLAYRINAALFAIAMIGGFVLAGDIPFNGLELIWDARQTGYLAALFVLLAIPFFFAANCIGLALLWRRQVLHRVYLFDLLGAGTGAVAILGLLFLLPLDACLRGLAATALIAALLGGWRQSGSGGGRMLGRGMLVAGAAMVAFAPVSAPLDKMSEFKGLPQTLAVSGARVVDQRSSPLGQLTVVENPVIPFRHAPGMSLMSGMEPPAQLAVFSDGDGMSAITRFDGDLAPLAYLDQLTSALPYHLLAPPEVLVLGAAGGAPVLQALYHQAARVDAVELNPQLVELVRGRYAGFAGWVYDQANVGVHVAEARAFVAGSARQYDLIQVEPLDAYGASGAGVHAQSASYVYTVEALREYYRHLRPGGILAITRWLKVPPRDNLKLLASVSEALSEEGVASPGANMMLIRGWQTATLLTKHGPFTEAEIATLHEFRGRRSFDVAWYPGITSREVNKYNYLERPWLFLGASALLGDGREAFLRDYKFNIDPARDDRPYFHQFFRWASLPELLGLGARGGLVLLDSGYLMVVATLCVALLLSIVLILLPLGRLPVLIGASVGLRGRVVVYFMALGLGFLFVEIAFIQRFTLYLGHPLYAVAVVLSAFLVFAGMGSGCTRWLRTRMRRLSPVLLVAGGIVCVALTYLVLLGPLFSATLALPDAARVVVAISLIAPLAFLMGMPFPLGLAKLAGEAPEFIPWAWGINGCASVLAALLATLLAIHAGFAAVVGLAAMLYLTAGAVFRGPLANAGRQTTPAPRGGR